MSKFSVKQTQAGFSFNLVADNGQVVSTSQVYTSKATCLKGIKSVQASAPLAPVEDQTAKGFEARECPKFEIYNDKAGKFRFRLRAGNGEIIVDSQGYKAKSSCLNGIDSVRVNAVTADTVEEKPSATNSDPSSGTDNAAPDYSKPECWYRIPEITKDVDTFYIYSTMYYGANEGDPDFAPLGNAEVQQSIGIEHAIKSSVFEDATNLFIPYYRQAGMSFVLRTMEKTGSIDASMSGTPCDDITHALDYYFEHYNEGRPFVIAGHSQGAAILRLVLKGYFREHPEYYRRMVAAYAIGFSVTKDFLASNPHLKFATGENDTGVIISWNTEGPVNVAENATNVLVLPGAISINPLNWKCDETYAPAGMNLGSIVMDANTGATEIRDIGGDAQVNLARGTVVTHADAVPNEMQEYTGPQCYHQDDYSIFYNNIKANVAARVAAYKSNNK